MTIGPFDSYQQAGESADVEIVVEKGKTIGAEMERDAAVTTLGETEQKLRRARRRAAYWQQKYEDTQNPAPTSTLIGSSLEAGKGTWDAFVGRLGKDLDCHRTYEDRPAPISQMKAREDVGKRVAIVATKFGSSNGFTAWPDVVNGDWDDEVLAMYRSIPDDELFIHTPHHEPTGGHENPTPDGDPEVWVPAMQRICGLRDEVNETRSVKILVGATLMGWDISEHGVAWTDEWVDGIDWDFIAWDIYTQNVNPTPMAQRMSDHLAYCEDKGLPAAIAETGCPKASVEDRAEWIRGEIEWARQVPLLFWTYWNSSFNFLTTPTEHEALAS